MTKLQVHIIHDLAELGYGITDIAELAYGIADIEQWETRSTTITQIKNVILKCINSGLAANIQLETTYTNVGATGWYRAWIDYNNIICRRTK